MKDTYPRGIYVSQSFDGVRVFEPTPRGFDAEYPLDSVTEQGLEIVQHADRVLFFHSSGTVTVVKDREGKSGVDLDWGNQALADEKALTAEFVAAANDVCGSRCAHSDDDRDAGVCQMPPSMARCLAKAGTR